MHVSDVPQLNILEASKAKLFFNGSSGNSLDSGTLKLVSTNLKALVGVYRAEIGLKEKEKIITNIKIFVIDDNRIVQNKQQSENKNLVATGEAKTFLGVLGLGCILLAFVLFWGWYKN